jgi:hypothetical protein
MIFVFWVGGVINGASFCECKANGPQQRQFVFENIQKKQ